MRYKIKTETLLINSIIVLITATVILLFFKKIDIAFYVSCFTSIDLIVYAIYMEVITNKKRKKINEQ